MDGLEARRASPRWSRCPQTQTPSRDPRPLQIACAAGPARQGTPTWGVEALAVTT